MKKFLAILTAAAACFGLSACGSDMMLDGNNAGGDPGYSNAPNSGNEWIFDESDNYYYNDIIEQGFVDVGENSTSYFSLDRNTASYSLVRTQIQNGNYIYSDSVRVEEMINYFDYDFPAPEEKAVGVTGYLSDCPWNAENNLLLVGLKTTEYNLSDVNANYVFLIDVSGSMSGNSRLGLAKKGLNLLVDELGDRDLVSIVTYASGIDTVLDGGECSESGKSQIKSKISSLTASGSTNGSGGLERAYSVAEKHFITGGNNRVIIISDGDFNVGISNQTQLKEFIQDKAASGIYLSVLGVGMGNMRDDILETLATSGNGNYAYLDNENEARKVFVEELSGTLFTVAKDAKAGVTFTDSVEKYRLVGYDAKLISEDDYNNDDADAGEIGSNLCVAALYEIKIAENAEESSVLAEAEVKYKDVISGEEETNESVGCVITLSSPSSDDLSFISCVAEFGLILRQSAYRGSATITDVLARLDSLSDYISGDAYKQEFVTLVGLASEKGIYEEINVNYIEEQFVKEFNDSSAFELKFLESVENKDLSQFYRDPGFGCDGYVNLKYGITDEGAFTKISNAEVQAVYYNVTAYPDEADGGQFVTDIICSDPEITFMGNYTVDDFAGFFNYLKSKGFTVYSTNDTSNGYDATCGNISISGTEGRSIRIYYRVSNKTGIMY